MSDFAQRVKEVPYLDDEAFKRLVMKLGSLYDGMRLDNDLLPLIRELVDFRRAAATYGGDNAPMIELVAAIQTADDEARERGRRASALFEELL
jgi:hypothetical protein